jgi:hypothetical protein
MKLFYIVKGSKIYTDLRNQTAPSQRPFRLIGVVKVTTKPSKVDYDKKITYWHWVLEYRYTDKSNLQEGFNIEIDYFDNFFSFDKIN